jgi:3-oxoacyl-[acyl-carrier protein] reductase
MVVTGASRGLGRGIAEHFTRAGYAVAGCSRGPFEGAEIENYKHYLVDVCDEHAVRVWSRQVKRDFGRIDVVVANVGMVKLGAVTGATSLEMFRSFVDGILVTTFLVCKEFSTLMAVQKQGRIITISSIMSELHAPGTCAYASAKKGVVEFTKVLAKELLPFNVTCNCISPSLIETDSAKAFGEAWEQNMLEMQSIRRAVKPSEICNIIDFFASPKSACVTGQVIHTCLVD